MEPLELGRVCERRQQKGSLMASETHEQISGKGHGTLTRSTVIVTEEDAPLLLQLAPPHREILLAKGNYKEVGLNLRLPLGTVRSRLHRARAALNRLREEGSTLLH
jgi:DNA-directed RNA polymerase specialized sigma24 family protein